MSATNRGSKREINDFYPTPAWCVERLLDRLPQLRRVGSIIEPCVGDGAILKAMKLPSFFINSGNIAGVDVNRAPIGHVWRHYREDFRSFVRSDYKYDLAITNPPFDIALEILQAALRISRRTVFLFRLNFLGSAKRHPFFSQNMPDIYILPNRPSFVKGTTDNCEYAWFDWPNTSVKRREGSIELLRLTPKADRGK